MTYVTSITLGGEDTWNCVALPNTISNYYKIDVDSKGKARYIMQEQNPNGEKYDGVGKAVGGKLYINDEENPRENLDNTTHGAFAPTSYLP